MVSVEFWLAQQGPMTGGDPRRTDQRCIGEVVCPECNNILARLYDSSEGVEVTCWVPAHGAMPGDDETRSVGWRLYTCITDATPETASALPCWRGHHGFQISIALCREIVTAYRDRGKRVRRPATAIEDASAVG